MIIHQYIAIIVSENIGELVQDKHDSWMISLNSEWTSMKKNEKNIYNKIKLSIWIPIHLNLGYPRILVMCVQSLNNRWKAWFDVVDLSWLKQFHLVLQQARIDITLLGWNLTIESFYSWISLSGRTSLMTKHWLNANSCDYGIWWCKQRKPNSKHWKNHCWNVDDDDSVKETAFHMFQSSTI